MSRSQRRLLVALASLGLLALLGAPMVGIYRLPLESLLDPQGTTRAGRILWSIRLPRVCLALLAGSSLALCGMTLQALLRNPLATPQTVGVSSGAALGATLYVRLGAAFSVFGVSGLTWSAFAGALTAALVIGGLSRMREADWEPTLLLAGVAMSFSFSSLILFLQYTSDLVSSFRIVHWLMGGLSQSGWPAVLQLLPFALLGSVAILLHSSELNLLTLGEEAALSRGLATQRTKTVLLVITSLTIGSVVSVCGPIGFVGLIVPHTCRLLIGADHRYLGVASLLAGGTFLLLCDTFARTVAAPTDIPVGIVTAFLGGPFFLWLLLTRRGYGLSR